MIFATNTITCFICEYFKDARKFCELLKRKGKKSLFKLAQFANVFVITLIVNQAKSSVDTLYFFIQLKMYKVNNIDIIVSL